VCSYHWSAAPSGGVSLFVKQLKDCATGLHISLGQATVARGVPAMMPLLSEGPGSLVREEATKSRMRNLIRICGQPSEVLFSKLGLQFAPPEPRDTAPLCSARRVAAEIKSSSAETPTSAFSKHLAELTRQRSQDGGGRPRADLWQCALHDHPERRPR
jgi:hypothetical protein